MSDGSVISIPDSDISLQTVIYDHTDKNTVDQAASRLKACALFASHWTDGAIKDIKDLNTVKKNYVDGLTEKSTESPTIVFEKGEEIVDMDVNRTKSSHGSRSPVRSNKGDACQKENSLRRSTETNGISVRRQTDAFSQRKDSVAATGRRKTIFIDAPKKSHKFNLTPTVTPSSNKKSSKSLLTTNVRNPEGNRPQLASSLANIVTEKERKEIIKAKLKALTVKNHSKNLSNNEQHKSSLSSHQSASSANRPESSQRSAISYQPETSHRPETLHRPESSTEQTDASSPKLMKLWSHRLTSPTHRPSTSAHQNSPHRPAASSKHTEPKSRSSSTHSERSERSSHRRSSDCSDHKSTKRKSSKDGHPDHHTKKSRPSTESKSFNVPWGESVPEKAQTKEVDALARLDQTSNYGRSLDEYKIPKPIKLKSRTFSSMKTSSKHFPTNSQPLKTSMRDAENLSHTKLNRTKKNEPSDDRVNSKCEHIASEQKIRRTSSSKKRIPDGMNPNVSLKRLKLEPLQCLAKGDRRLVLTNETFTVYYVNKKFKIKSQQVHHTESEKHRKRESVDVASSETHRNFSQQTSMNVFTRDFGVQKNDDEAAAKTKEHVESIALFTQSVKEYDSAVCEQQQTIESLKQQIAIHKESIRERENKIAERERMITERDAKIVERDRMIVEREARIVERDRKLMEYDEKIRLQESNINSLQLQVNTLKQSERSLSDSLENKTKEFEREKLTLSKARDLSTVSSIRVKSMDQLTGKQLNPAIATSANVIQSSSGMGWISAGTINTQSNFSHQVNTQSMRQSTIQSTLQSTPTNLLLLQQLTSRPIQPATTGTHSTQQSTYQNVSPSVRYRCMYDIQQLSQSTSTSTNTNNAQPATSNSTTSTPHQNLPRIVQKLTRPLIRPNAPITVSNPTSDLNSTFTQNGSTHNPTQTSLLRSRAKSCYFGTRPVLNNFSEFRPNVQQQMAPATQSNNAYMS